MTTLREAAEAVQEPQGCDHCNHPLYAAVKCRVCGRVTEPVQEPVAWMVYTEGGASAYVTDNPNDLVGAYRALPLYTAPPQRLPLTDEEIADIVVEMNGNEPTALFWRDLARAIEAAHGIGSKT